VQNFNSKCNGKCNREGSKLTTSFLKHNTVRVDGHKLTQARIAAKLSLQDVADHLKCNISSVSRWEQGKLNPSEERVILLTKLYRRGDFILGSTAKLTPDQVRKIGELCRAKELSQRIIGEMFGVSGSVVGEIHRSLMRKEEGVEA
jgi:DNA-binding transcriptional regulator YiaG